MNCSSCSPSLEKKDNQHKCKICNSISEDKTGECCGAQREKICSCGSGK